MSDLISRKALCEYALNQKDKSITPNDIMRFPSAHPEQRWIPVGERLPEVHESGNSFSGIYMQSVPVLVYGICEGEKNAQFHVVTYCDDLDGTTYWSTELDTLTITKVTAWMPLPEPYREEGGEE